MLNEMFFFFLWQSFFEGQSASWDVAKKEQNRTKNRYGNIIACEFLICEYTTAVENCKPF